MENFIETWTLTDPDNFQYGRRISKGVFQFKEYDKDSNPTVNKLDYDCKRAYVVAAFDDDCWIEATIDISHYSDEQKEEAINGYYTSLDALKEICGGDMEQVDWIVAECEFEQNSGLY